MNSLLCETGLRFRATLQFHHGGGGPGVYFFLREWAELGEGRETYDVYYCPNCGHVELFLDGVGEEYRPQ